MSQPSRPQAFTIFAGNGHQLATFVRKRLWLRVLLAMVFGVTTGVLLGPASGLVAEPTAQVIGNWLALPGQLFLDLIQMIVIPLIIASIVRGLTATDDLQQLKRMGLSSGIYFVLTTAIAIAIGMAVALQIQPGRFVDSTQVQQALAVPLQTGTEALQPLSFGELPSRLATLLPSNPLSSMVEGQMLQVVLFAIIFGIAIVMKPSRQTKALLDVMEALQQVCMTVVHWAMWLAPLAVFGMLAQITIRVGLKVLGGMAIYVMTVLLALLILMVLYLLLVWIFTRMAPLPFLKAVREVLLLAFSTSSSAAVMPMSLRTAQERLGVRPFVAQFVIPLGATINMNGTALYQGVAAIFIAQVFGIDLSLGSMLLIIVTAVGASIGSPATPGVGIVILAMVLESAGIPASGIALIIGVDRILDMSRTAVNVCGDLVAARLLDRYLGNQQQVPAAAIASEERP